MMKSIKLMLTVSGGLEGLAERQIRECFYDDGQLHLMDLTCNRKPSGSQLVLTLSAVNHQPIATLINRLDYVEYVYALLDSTRISVDDAQDQCLMLRKVEECTSQVSPSSIDFCKRLCEDTSRDSSSIDAGLDGLPGLLLATPEVSSLDPQSPQNDSCRPDFDVNTIYTKSNVAHAVITKVSNFVEEIIGINDISTNGGKDNGEILWVDAGAGNGSLLEHMPQQHTIGIDTHPASERVRRMDFLELSRDSLNEEFPHHDVLVVVSNPPFASSSRGDFTSIVEFVNHSFDELNANAVAIICPCKFARVRIWRSLGMTEKAVLAGRFFLPQNAFYDPSTGKDVHIHSYCLLFSKGSALQAKDTRTPSSKIGVYLSAKRDKGAFAGLATGDLAKAVVSGLSEAGLEFAPERDALHMLNARLTGDATLELWWQLNHGKPNALANSNSIKVPNHSLGWISLSVKPAYALAMASMSMPRGNSKETRLAVNLMSGEGTLELEASRAVDHSFFMISGDKSRVNAKKSYNRLQMLDDRRPLVDFVVWDAQNLPLRKGIADAIFADLPIQGSSKKVHQEPTMGTARQASAVSPSHSYSCLMREAARTLSTKGRAALLSPDFKALRHACGGLNWSQVDSLNVNLGGLNAKLYVMERKHACTKDLSVWVPPSAEDMSSWILDVANEACIKKKCPPHTTSLPVTSVRLHSTFFHEREQRLSHCYRITFDDMIKNTQAKELEQLIRNEVATATKDIALR